MMREIGYWDAVAWVSLFLVFFIISYFFLGKRRKTEKTDEFLCGEEFDYSTPAHNFFYGFESSLGPIFNVWRRFHSEVINEYVAWILVFGLFSLIMFSLMLILEVNVV